jgi:hypothetical protein
MADDQVSRPPYFLLAICAGLIVLGILTIAVAPGFFMNLLGAGIFASGGSAAYLILSHRDNQMRRS